MTPPATTELAGFRHHWIPREGASRTLLLLHGTGGNETDLLSLGEMIDPAANLLSPRGQVLEHGMPRFFRRLAEGVFDLDDLRIRTDALAEFITAAATTHGVAIETLVAVGFSNGANIAASVMLQCPAALHAGILLRAMLPFEPPAVPDLRAHRALLLSSANDPIGPGAQPERLAALLRSGGAAVTLEWVPGGHQLTRADLTHAQRWLTRP
ncbi:MAG: alpha/beta hydrolase [Gemmatimonadaceae bacterium]